MMKILILVLLVSCEMVPPESRLQSGATLNDNGFVDIDPVDSDYSNFDYLDGTWRGVEEVCRDNDLVNCIRETRDVTVFFDGKSEQRSYTVRGTGEKAGNGAPIFDLRPGEYSYSLSGEEEYIVRYRVDRFNGELTLCYDYGCFDYVWVD